MDDVREIEECLEPEVGLTKTNRSGVADKKGVRIGDVISSYSAGSSGSELDRFVRTARPSYRWSARLLFAVEPRICASRRTSGCGRGALGNSGVVARRWTTLERQPRVEREVGPFPVYVADVGFPVGALAVLRILRMRGAKLCIVFHDIRNDQAHGWKNG